ncbi:MAG: hypothetical protein OK436_05005 [Thaumarchaeota archaeon]|nr:hypothetical protein [Nitrososphaerota archaeon]
MMRTKRRTSYSNPYRRNRAVEKYEICFGSPSEVVEQVNERLAGGWSLDDKTHFFFSTNQLVNLSEVYAAQVMVLYHLEVEEEESEMPEVASELTQ